MHLWRLLCIFTHSIFFLQPSFLPHDDPRYAFFRIIEDADSARDSISEEHGITKPPEVSQPDIPGGKRI